MTVSLLVHVLSQLNKHTRFTFWRMICTLPGCAPDSTEASVCIALSSTAPCCPPTDVLWSCLRIKMHAMHNMRVEEFDQIRGILMIIKLHSVCCDMLSYEETYLLIELAPTCRTKLVMTMRNEAI